MELEERVRNESGDNSRCPSSGIGIILWRGVGGSIASSSSGTRVMAKSAHCQLESCFPNSSYKRVQHCCLEMRTFQTTIKLSVFHANILILCIEDDDYFFTSFL